MFKNATLIISSLLLASCMHKTPNNFFAKLSQYCGQSIEGKTVFPDDPNHAFVNKKLIMYVAKCTGQEIRIPFKVGEDTSRTWIISKTNKGLLLKHDHRHADGTPDEITMYGGYADSKSTPLSVNFVADVATAKMLPEASTNVWTLSFDKKNKQFIYSLKRHNKPRYEAVFDLLPY
jgi:hypothetical protein